MIWLGREDVEAFHAMQIAEFGGLAGTRDVGALESALARPHNLTAYGQPTAFELAATDAFGIARNHPFVDGNKRTALVTSFVFLELNGFDVTAAEIDAVLVFVDLAAGKISEADLAKWLKNNTKPQKARRK